MFSTLAAMLSGVNDVMTVLGSLGDPMRWLSVLMSAMLGIPLSTLTGTLEGLGR
jgi:hypothetical protein